MVFGSRGVAAPLGNTNDGSQEPARAGERAMNTVGMTTIELANRETGETATYPVTDLHCARMLAAEDHGGEPEDWLTSTEIAEEAE